MSESEQGERRNGLNVKHLLFHNEFRLECGSVLYFIHQRNEFVYRMDFRIATAAAAASATAARNETSYLQLTAIIIINPFSVSEPCWHFSLLCKAIVAHGSVKITNTHLYPKLSGQIIHTKFLIQCTAKQSNRTA